MHAAAAAALLSDVSPTHVKIPLLPVREHQSSRRLASGRWLAVLSSRGLKV